MDEQCSGSDTDSDELIGEEGPRFMPPTDRLLYLLREAKFNWLSFVSECQFQFQDVEDIDTMLDSFIERIGTFSFNENEKSALQQSREAYKALESEYVGNHDDHSDAFHTDSESDNPEDWVNISQTKSLCENFKKKIAKQKGIISRWKKRRVAKIVASKCLLRRKVPPRVSKTLSKYPNIGKDIERFARDNRIGADSWRRTGLLTFSGNTKKGPKLTYNRIRRYLEDKYKTTFSYGTIVQLCCARNKRRQSAKRYWGAAKIVSRRARKGFNVKLNVDAH